MREPALWPTFIERDDLHLVGLSIALDETGSAEIPELWERLRPLEDTIPNRKDGVRYGAVEVSDKGDGTFDYLAAVAVARGAATPDGLVAKTLAGGRFAVFTHSCDGGPLGPGLQATMRMIHGEWVRMSRTPLRAYYDLEVYDQRFNPATLTGEIDIWIPVA